MPIIADTSALARRMIKLCKYETGDGAEGVVG